jgi:putative oxygen-independent coproporphyrinogen III oxidase
VVAQAPVDVRTGLQAARFGVYLHFPFCLSKCPYCDFASIAARELPEVPYTAALEREFELRVAAFGLRGRVVHSIFIGGGTPSLWRPALVARVLERLASTLAVADGCEVTLEANPGAADSTRFAAYRAAGVNRLSMGVQSFEPSTLAALGRAHDGPTAVRAFEAARAAGFDNLSLDFIYGVHGQTLAQVERDAHAAVALAPEHLSAYALTLDRESLAEEVPLARALQRGEVRLPADDTVVAMQRAVRDVYAGAGLGRYEVSNYARPGRHSRHNSLYWTGGEYLALGVGATGTVTHQGAHLRYANHRSAEVYLRELAAGRLVEGSRETLTELELFEERVAMGLRLVSGVDLKAVCADFGQPYQPRSVTVTQLEKAGLAVTRDGRLALTDAGFDVHSEICARLM